MPTAQALSATKANRVCSAPLRLSTDANTDTETDTDTDTDMVIRDADHDGYASDVDCDDNDYTVFPGAEELCDQRDNDCDGDTDEGVGSPWYQDSDGDGYGNGSVSTTACTAPIGYVGNALDCDDFSAATSPAAYEICDGADNDCDTDIDDLGPAAIYVGSLSAGVEKR